MDSIAFPSGRVNSQHTTAKPSERKEEYLLNSACRHVAAGEIDRNDLGIRLHCPTLSMLNRDGPKDKMVLIGPVGLYWLYHTFGNPPVRTCDQRERP
jgi:hypothetical protein